MSIDEFEVHYRESMREVLDQLQSVVLLSAQLEEKVANIGLSLDELNQATEQFLDQQRGVPNGATAP